MKKIYRVKNLDCAHCANKMQCALKKLDGINDVSINFLTQKMTIDAVDENFDEILEKTLKICKKVDKDFEIEAI